MRENQVLKAARILTTEQWLGWGQAKQIYGPEIANTIRSNHQTKIFMAGISDPDILGYLKNLLGPIFVNVTGNSVDHRGELSVSVSQTQVDLLPESRAREMETSETLAVVGERRPMRLRMPAWYESATMRALIDPEVAAMYDAEHAQDEGEEP